MNNTLNNEYLFLAFAETSTDATKTKTDYTYPTTADVLSIVQDTHLSYASGYDATGQLDTSEVVGAGTTVTLGAGYENKHLWLYKDKSGAYGTTEYRPLEGLTRNDADKWGVESPLDASLRTNAPHTGYESSTGVASSSAGLAWMAFDKKTSADGNTFGNVTNCWLQYKQTEKRILKSWRMKAGGSWSASPRRFTIEGSNDGLNWTAIDSTYTASDFTLDYSL